LLRFVLYYTGCIKLYKIKISIVWIIRYRRKILATGVKRYLKIKFQEIRKCCSDWECTEIGIEKDHIYLYMVIPPKYAVNKIVKAIKSNTNKMLENKIIKYVKYQEERERQEEIDQQDFGLF